MCEQDQSRKLFFKQDLPPYYLTKIQLIQIGSDFKITASLSKIFPIFKLFCLIKAKLRSMLESNTAPHPAAKGQFSRCRCGILLLCAPTFSYLKRGFWSFSPSSTWVHFMIFVPLDSS